MCVRSAVQNKAFRIVAVNKMPRISRSKKKEAVRVGLFSVCVVVVGRQPRAKTRVKRKQKTAIVDHAALG
jgi:hypothetical protein